MSELFAVLLPLFFIDVFVLFFGLIYLTFHGIAVQSHDISYQNGVIDGARRALNPKNNNNGFIRISIEENDE